MDTASESQGEKALWNVLELREEGFRGPELHHGPATLSPTPVSLRGRREDPSHAQTKEMVITSGQCFHLGPF